MQLCCFFVLCVILKKLMLSLQVRVTMNVTHFEYRRDFTMHTKLSGKVFFTYNDKKNPTKQPAKQHAYICEILQPYADQGSWEILNKKKVKIITTGEVEMRYYIQKQTDVTPVKSKEKSLDHTGLWVEVSNSTESPPESPTQDDTRGNQARRGRPHKGAQHAPNREVQVASSSGRHRAQRKQIYDNRGYLQLGSHDYSDDD